MEMMKSIKAHARLEHSADPIVRPQADAASSAPEEMSTGIDLLPPLPNGITPLSPTYLESRRIVSFRPNHRLTRAYDLLRNQIEQEVSLPLKMIAVAAPSAGCGTSITAANLAFSFARFCPGRVALIDADRSAPAASELLGISPLADIAKGAHVLLDVEGVRLSLIRPSCDQCTYRPVDALANELHRLQENLRPSVMVVDLAPLLSCDEAVQVLRKANVGVLVLATGHSKRNELEVCRSLFKPDQNLQIVLNKARRHGL